MHSGKSTYRHLFRYDQLYFEYLRNFTKGALFQILTVYLNWEAANNYIW